MATATAWSRRLERRALESPALPHIDPDAVSWILHLTREVAQAYRARLAIDGEAIVLGEENVAYRVGIPREWRHNALYDARAERRRYEGLSKTMEAAAMEGARQGRLVLDPDPELDSLREKARALEIAASRHKASGNASF